MGDDDVFQGLVQVVDELRDLFEGRVEGGEVVLGAPVGEVRAGDEEGVLTVEVGLQGLDILALTLLV